MPDSEKKPDGWSLRDESLDSGQWNAYIRKYHLETTVDIYSPKEAFEYRNGFFSILKGKSPDNPSVKANLERRDIPAIYHSSLMGGMVEYLYGIKKSYDGGENYINKNNLDSECSDIIRQYLSQINDEKVPDNFTRNKINDLKMKSSFFKELTTTLLSHLSKFENMEQIIEDSLFIYHSLSMRDLEDKNGNIEHFNNESVLRNMKDDIGIYYNSAILAIEEHFIRNKYMEKLTADRKPELERIAKLYYKFMRCSTSDLNQNPIIDSPVIQKVFRDAGIITVDNYLKKHYKSQPL